jgi:hypothetical protein
MSKSDVFALQHSALNEFLYAAVGMEANGTTLSLVSVFARQGNDPWREAGRLVGLPRSDAIRSVATDIAGMPRSLWTLADATAIATRLVALLPPPPASVGSGPARDDTRAGRLVGLGLMLAAIAFGTISLLGLFAAQRPSSSGNGDIAPFTSAKPSAASPTMDGAGGGPFLPPR